MSDRSRELIERLRLARHPEGGWYRQLHRSPVTVETAQGTRSAITTIYYLLEQGEVSRWHVVDADEIWHFYDGSALELVTYDPQTGTLTRSQLGSPGKGSEPVSIVPAGVWQTARSRGAYSLVGCSVGPGFEFAGFKFVSSMPDHERHFKGKLEPFSNLL